MNIFLPRGIYRDDTVHDRLYYTRAQLLLYGRACYDLGLDGDDPPGQPNEPEPATNPPNPSDDKTVEFLSQILGMKK